MMNFQRIERITELNRIGQRLILTAATRGGRPAYVSLEFLTPFVFELRAALAVTDLDPTDDVMEPFVERVRERFPAQYHETDEQVSIDTGAIQVVLSKDPWGLVVRDQRGQVVARQSTDDLSNLEIEMVRNLGFELNRSGAVTAAVQSIRMHPEEHFYGLGEKCTPIDKRGQRLTLWHLDAWGNETEKAYKNIPFFMSTRGYGVFINTAEKVDVSFGVGRRTYHKLDPDARLASFMLEGWEGLYRDADDYKNVANTESLNSYTFQTEDRVLDYFFIYGPAFSDILTRYTALTGRAPVPPKWSFGYWNSGSVNLRSTELFLAEAEELRRRDIPVDVIGLSHHWTGDDGYGTFDFYQPAFPDPKSMIERVTAMGFKFRLGLESQMSDASEWYREGAAKGYFLTKPDGSIYKVHTGSPKWHEEEPQDPATYEPTEWQPFNAIVDFTNPQAKRWWQSGVKKMLDYGARVFHADFGEEIPRDAVFFNGKTGKQMHNIYPNLYGQALYEAFEEFAVQPVIANRRSGWAGMQRYPICWSGDPKCTFESMAHVLRGGLSIGLSGVPFWSHDIGGHVVEPTPELFVRWAQFGMFSAHARTLGVMRRAPWDFGDEALEIFRRYVKLRYRLIPYIYTYAHVAARSGLPLIRAMVLEFQDDPSTYHLDLQYMFGGEFLVAPIFDTTGERSVYLPAGAWYDYWTKERLTGPKHIVCRAPLDTLPLFVKGGAIIPMGPEMSYVGEKPCSPITLDVYPEGRSRFTIRDDDGDTEIRVRAEREQIDVEIDESQCEFEVVINRVASARAVTLNGRDLPSLSEPAPGTYGFFIDSSRLVASFAGEGRTRLTVVR